MVSSVLEQYSIADLYEWFKQKRLVINPSFQRRSVWKPSAKTYLIDTILRKLPVPKIYIRQKIDLGTHISYREVVDGQQRLRAIFDFASDKLVLSSRAKEFRGKTYSTLDDEYKERFLSYAIGSEQLINASDDDVLEVFSRLNSYTVPLNNQELRHATYQGDFKWSVHEASKRWSKLWEKYQVLSVRERVRMLDDQAMAEMFGIILRGISTGSQPRITKLYSVYNDSFDEQEDVNQKLDVTIEYILKKFNEVINTSIARAPHFLMFYGAIAHALHGIPAGDIGDEMPKREDGLLSNKEIATENMLRLAEIIDMDEEESNLLDKDEYNFWYASYGTTQGIKSRKVRFLYYFRALLPRLVFR